MLSLAMPSSISRDLRTPSPRPSATRTRPSSYATKSPASALVVPSADGELSKICGSLVEPEDRRQQWCCHACKTVFPRDATIYLAPTPARSEAGAKVLGDAASSLNRRLAATSASQEHYCRGCYAGRFALGDCIACFKPVLGSTKEDGKFVRSGGQDGRIWHGRCWACVPCGTKDTDAGISIGMDGRPTCAECFDLPTLNRRTAVNTADAKGMACPSSSNKNPGHRISPTSSASALSGMATRQGMGAAIAELSKKFGKPVPPSSSASVHPSKNTSPVLAQHSGSQPGAHALTRSNSITARARPLTAQFSGQGFNLAAFQSSSMHRSDSRSRSASPTKQLESPAGEGQRQAEKDRICAKCLQGPFDGPNSMSSGEARMISLRNTDNGVMYHTQCFRCAVCSESLEGAARSFVRLDDGEFAHPACAPPVVVTRTVPSNVARPMSMASSASSTDIDHATHQRLPRPTLEGERPLHNLPSSYLMPGGAKEKTGPMQGLTEKPSLETSPTKAGLRNDIRRFQPSSGAAPPTRSTLLHVRSSGQTALNHSTASLAVSSGLGASKTSGASLGPTRFSRLGGMLVCGGCGVAVSSLEGVPGPRGQSWHRKCLVCSATPAQAGMTGTGMSANLRYGKVDAHPRCGKQLDSSAKVTAQGQLRCRECYDRENGRHRLGR